MIPIEQFTTSRSARFTVHEHYPDTRYHGKDWHPDLVKRPYRRYVALVQDLAAYLFPDEADQVAWGRKALSVSEGHAVFHPVYLSGSSRTNPGFGETLVEVLETCPKYKPLLAIMR